MLTATTKHALRALVHLSRVPEGDSILGRDLAEQASIPANFLAKILLRLRNAGLVEATRGLGGGYRLARSAQEIRLIQIADLFEGASFRQSECFLGEKRVCNDQGGCSAHPAWKRVKEVYLDFLNTQTIADIGASEELPRTRAKTRPRSRK